MKKRSICYVLILLAVLLTACSAGKKDSGSVRYDYSSTGESTGMSADNGKGSDVGYTNSVDTTTAEEPKNAASGEMDNQSTSNNSDTNRKRIRKIDLSLETLEFDKTQKVITEQIQKSGGYVESSSIYGSKAEDRDSRSAQYVLRIPADQADSFVEIMGNKMNLIHKEESSKDVTLDYIDTESKIKALKVEQERLLILLEKATKLEDIITLEDRMSTVRYQLEQNASTLRTYDNLVEYATITLNIEEVLRISPPESRSNGDRMKTGFTNSLLNMRDGFVEVVICFVVNLPYIVFWGIIIGLSVFISIKVYYKKDKKASPIQKVNSISNPKEEEKENK